ncbi:flavocytochrome c [Lacrimispora defluvii]|uniref:Urocanate reductase n=1 Tax=Lacrimispora defluvii TaxID=2719233 RepID=A0ABX1VNB7_9FIRM|nr:flavocytochrome c [Lacrimispora defluvii]NNJ29831.1 flavocytochrome c [Lacrimispora defluvii]
MKKGIFVGIAAMAAAAAAVIVLSGPAYTSLDKSGKKNVQEAAAEGSLERESKENEKQADIVIIGAGGAGMTAAVEATQKGATNLIVLEKMPITGGNTVRATGGLNAAETPYQKADGIEDSIELFVEDTMKGGKNLNDPKLVQVMAEQSADAVTWVNEIGGDLSVVGQFGGASVKRIHRPSDTSAVGPMLVNALNAKLKELDVPVFLETEAVHILLNEEGAVTGVQAATKGGEPYTISCKAVILASGGFGANSELVVKYRKDLDGFCTTNHSGATGDGIVMAEELKAGLVDIDQIQTHPTVNPDTTTMYTEGVRGNGAILVNRSGKRFVNELETRDVVSEAILNQEGKTCFMVFDQSVRESLSAIEKYIGQGIITQADTPEELAEAIGVDKDQLKATLEQYANYQTGGKDTEFGRESMEVPLNMPPYYAGLCAPAVHHTMGGVKIDTATQVLKEDGNAIPGLFAAGEVVGGVHGANRLGGNAVTDIVVFGRLAGNAAYDYVMKNGGFTEKTMKAAGEEEAAQPEVKGNYKDGTYTGTGKGNNGDITVEVVVKDGSVTSVELTDHHETPGIYEAAEKAVTAAIIRTQNTTVDGVSGATNSSNGIKEAVAEALEKAK